MSEDDMATEKSDWKGKRNAAGVPVMEFVQCCSLCGAPLGTEAVAYFAGWRHPHCQPREDGGRH